MLRIQRLESLSSYGLVFTILSFLSAIAALWVVLFLSSATAHGQVPMPPATVHNVDSDEWFHWIQDAIDDADTDSGDTIEVYDASLIVHPGGEIR